MVSEFLKLVLSVSALVLSAIQVILAVIQLKRKPQKIVEQNSGQDLKPISEAVPREKRKQD